MQSRAKGRRIWYSCHNLNTKLISKQNLFKYKTRTFRGQGAAKQLTWPSGKVGSAGHVGSRGTGLPWKRCQFKCLTCQVQNPSISQAGWVVGHSETAWQGLPVDKAERTVCSGLPPSKNKCMPKAGTESPTSKKCNGQHRMPTGCFAENITD